MQAAGGIEQQVREFIRANFLYGRVCCIKDDDSLASNGIIDSIGVIQLVAFLEETYSIKVEDEELTPEHLDSIRSIITYLRRKRSSSEASSAEVKSLNEDKSRNEEQA